MRKAKALLIFLTIFLSLDSSGLASMAQMWIAMQFPQINSAPQIPTHLMEPKSEALESLRSINLDYKSFRKIQTSA